MDAELVVRSFDPLVGDPVGVMEGEDLVFPFEQRLAELLDLGGMVGVDVEERYERLVASNVVGCRRGVEGSARRHPSIPHAIPTPRPPPAPRPANRHRESHPDSPRTRDAATSSPLSV